MRMRCATCPTPVDLSTATPLWHLSASGTPHIPYPGTLLRHAPADHQGKRASARAVSGLACPRGGYRAALRLRDECPVVRAAGGGGARSLPRGRLGEPRRTDGRYPD